MTLSDVLLESGSRFELDSGPYFSTFRLILDPSDSDSDRNDFCIFINCFANVASTDKCRLISNTLLCCGFLQHDQIVNTESYKRSASSGLLDLDLNSCDLDLDL